MNEITVTFQNGHSVKCKSGTRVGTLASSQAAESGLPYIAALVNNDVASMSYPLTVTSEVRYLTIEDPHGWRVYRRSLCFLLAKAINDVFPKAKFCVEHSFGLGLYCTFQTVSTDTAGITVDQLESIEKKMREIVSQEIPIQYRRLSYMEAVREFEKNNQQDKLSLLRHRNPPRVVVYWCDGFSDLAHGPLVPHTGVMKLWKLIHYPPGFVLHLPDRTDPKTVSPFEDQPHLFNVFKEHKEWGRILGVTTAGRLNEIIAAGEIDNFVRINEALHEKKLADIADRIGAARDRVRLVLIAGPSSSGKTTFAKRLAVQLMVNGLRPVMLSTDNYFVGPDRNPIGPDGKPDFEHIEAVDLDLFNDDLLKLIGGGTIDLPRFNFSTKQREYKGDKLKIEKDQIIIIEGIHGLNPRLTRMVPAEHKFKIYVSALTQLNIDSNNRISTTDNRLMRRIVRDHMFRGHSALYTLQLWPGVRNGEKTWIFPFQREADATFNSALDYELAVLKPFVEPLLMQIKPDREEYAEARRLTEFLLNFVAATPTSVPRTSILREYIGGSHFKY